jgi:hypothetical protein
MNAAYTQKITKLKLPFIPRVYTIYSNIHLLFLLMTHIPLARVAQLARLTIPTDLMPDMQTQLDRILGYVNMLGQFPDSLLAPSGTGTIGLAHMPLAPDTPIVRESLAAAMLAGSPLPSLQNHLVIGGILHES